MKNLGKNVCRDYANAGDFFINNEILAALISSIPLASAFGFSNGKHLLTELKKYGFEAERVADYGCYCQFLTDGGVNLPGMVFLAYRMFSLREQLPVSLPGLTFSR